MVSGVSDGILLSSHVWSNGVWAAWKKVVVATR